MVPHLYKIIKDNMAYNKYRLNVMFVTTFFFFLVSPCVRAKHVILTVSTLGKIFSRRQFEIFFLIFARKQDLTFLAKCLHYFMSKRSGSVVISRPRWLSWMRRPTEDQEVACSTPAEVGNILSWRLIMKYYLRSFSPFR